MDKRLYFELMVELSHKDTWVHYYFVYYKTFVIFSFSAHLAMKGAIQGPFHQSLVAIGPVVSEEKIKM
jgi:hypothetical protein